MGEAELGRTERLLHGRRADGFTWRATSVILDLMTLSLEALANWEAVVLARMRGATGTPDERDAQITRSGLYAEYPAIIRAYSALAGPDPEISLEVIKRMLFLIWHSFKALPVDSGIS